MMRAMLWRAFRQCQLFVSQSADHGIDDVQHGLCGAKAGGNRQVAKFARPAAEEVQRFTGIRKRVRKAFEMLPRLLEAARVGPLEPVDRLLEIADHEERPVPFLALAGPAEELVDEPTDDLPLCGVGVLRLVDQHMVDLAIQLVPDPVAHSGLRKEPLRPPYEIVEIGDPGTAFRVRIGSSESLPGAEAGGDLGGQSGAVLDAKKFAHEDGEAPCLRFIMGLGFGLSGRNAQRVLVGEYDLAEPSQISGALDRCESQPILDDLGMANARLRAPPPVGGRHRPEKLAVEALAPALVSDIFLARAFRQVDQ